MATIFSKFPRKTGWEKIKSLKVAFIRRNTGPYAQGSPKFLAPYTTNTNLKKEGFFREERYE